MAKESTPKKKKLTMAIVRGQIELMLANEKELRDRVAFLEHKLGVPYSGSEADETSDFENSEDADDDSNDPPDLPGGGG